MKSTKGDLPVQLNLAQICISHGNWQAALGILLRAAEVHPGNADVVAPLAKLQMYLERPQDALRTLSDPAVAALNSPELMLLLGQTLLQLNRPEDGLVAFQKILALNPRSFAALLESGLALASQGQHELALKSFLKAQTANPQHPLASYNMGITLEALGDSNAALQAYDQTVQLMPTNVKAWFNKAQLLLQMGQYSEAVQAYRRLLALSPSHLESWVALAECHEKLNELKESVCCYDRALSQNPSSSSLLMAKGTALHKLGCSAEAQMCFEKVWELEPLNVAALSNKALCLIISAPSDALVILNQALSIDPNDTTAIYNKGVALLNLDRPAEAISCFRSVLTAEPDHADAHNNLGHVLLEQCDFAEGWHEYNWRWHSTGFSSRPLRSSKPKWNGKDRVDALLIWGEQGIGDQILYASLIPHVSEYAKLIYVVLDRRLHPLLSRSNPHCIFLEEATPEAWPDYTHHIAIGDLGRFFRLSRQDFSDTRPPHMKVNEKLTHALHKRIESPKQLICGLSWQSKNPHSGASKSLSLDVLLPILELPFLKFVDLQYGNTSLERHDFHNRHGIEIHRLEDIDNYNDIDSLASLIAACDIVVTCSNTTAHLAGAIGSPVLLLLPQRKGKFWYWHDSNGVSLWYPSVRVFQQAVDSNWLAPTRDVSACIEKIAISRELA